MKDIIVVIFTKYGLVGAFLVVGLTVWFSYKIAKLLKQERMGSAFAIVVGLLLAYIGGSISGGSKGLADLTLFSGVGLLGGSMFRDFAIISTAYGVELSNLKKAGLAGVVSLFIGIIFSFFVGVLVAYFLGYRNPVDLTTIGAGAITFIVGPVTGSALGASSAIVALSIAVGVVKSVLTMVLTPLIAKKVGLDNPTSAMIYGGLIGTTSGVAGGLAATDPKLVPYGAMTATFFTGLGSLLAPTILFFLVKLVF